MSPPLINVPQGMEGAVVRAASASNAPGYYYPEIVPPMAAQPQQQGDFMDTMRKLQRHWRLITLTTVGVGALCAAIALSLPPRYQAEARVLVDTPANGPKIFDINQVIGAAGADSAKVQSESLVIQGRTIAKQVVDRLQLDQDPEFNPALAVGPTFGQRFAGLVGSVVPNSGLSHWLAGQTAPTPAAVPAATNEAAVVDNLIGALDVAGVGQSNVIAIKAEASSREHASGIANAVAQAYLDSLRSTQTGQVKRADDYVQQQIATLRQQVNDSETAAQNYRRQNGLYSSVNANVSTQSVSEINSQLVAAQTAKAEADAHLAAATSGSSSVPEVLASPTIQSLKAQEAAAAQNLATLSARFGPKYPDVVNARAAVSDLQRKIGSETGAIIGGLKKTAQAADQHFASIQKNFGQAEGQAGGAGEKSIHLDELERDAQVNRNLLNDLLGREKEMVWQGDIQDPDARLISPASPPAGTSFPPRTLITALGILAGALIGMILALLGDSVDRTFRRYEDVEASTGLPVISMVPQRKGGAVNHVLQSPLSPFSEALRRIEVAVQMQEIDSVARSIMFCSATPAEGKSSIVASLGRLLAANGRRVLAVDCDWRHPSLHKMLRLNNKAGLVDLLRGESASLEDCIQHDEMSGLDVITTGVWNGKDSVLLTGERMRALQATFTRNYDLVLFDTAPILVGADVLMLARMVDKVVYTVRWGSTPRDAVFEALRQLLDGHVQPAGIVLSRVDPRRYRRYANVPLSYDYHQSDLPAVR